MRTFLFIVSLALFSGLSAFAQQPASAASVQRPTAISKPDSNPAKSTIIPKTATKPATSSTTAKSSDNRGPSTATKPSTIPTNTAAKPATAPKSQTTIPANAAAKGATAKPAAKTTAPKIKSAPATPPATIQWMSIEEAIVRSKTEPRKIIIDVYTDWCGWCKRMDETTFNDPAIVQYVNEKYYAVKFNAEQQGDIAFKDKVYKFKRDGSRGFHELAALWLNNRMSYPTTVILDEQLNTIQPIPGYLDAAKLDAIIHYFGTGSHRTIPWEKYERNFVRG